MKQLSYILVVLMSLTACEKAFLGEDEVNSPENNFEIFWNDFNEHYALFKARGWDWNSVYTTYRPQVNAQTTDDELWGIFEEMIAYLDDSHTFIYNPETDEQFVSGSEEDDLVETEFSLDLIKNQFLDYHEDIPGIGLEDEEDINFIYGKIKNKDIGYIHINGVEAEDEDFMDEVLKEIGTHKAIILDLRNNFGGDDQIAQAIAGRFADGKHFIYTVQEKNGPNPDDFADKKEYYTSLSGHQHFSKPLIVLTDKITVSAAEVLLLHLNAFEQVTQIGDSTAGDFSDTGMLRFLPNGFIYQYSIMTFLLPDGSSLDGIGHIPDIQIRNTAENIQNGEDLVMEKALDYLFEAYGIE